MSNAPTKEVPSRLALDLGAQRLRVTWADGHESEYASGYLRFLCPCAACRGHSPGEVEPPSWEASKDVTILDAQQVGGYALSFSFSDGHGSGIFAYDRLRASCVCAACAGRAPP